MKWDNILTILYLVLEIILGNKQTNYGEGKP